MQWWHASQLSGFAWRSSFACCDHPRTDFCSHHHCSYLLPSQKDMQIGGNKRESDWGIVAIFEQWAEAYRSAAYLAKQQLETRFWGKGGRIRGNLFDLPAWRCRPLNNLQSQLPCKMLASMAPKQPFLPHVQTSLRQANAEILQRMQAQLHPLLCLKSSQVLHLNLRHLRLLPKTPRANPNPNPNKSLITITQSMHDQKVSCLVSAILKRSTLAYTHKL